MVAAHAESRAIMGSISMLAARGLLTIIFPCTGGITTFTHALGVLFSIFMTANKLIHGFDFKILGQRVSLDYLVKAH